jgi:hypothetical protein
MKNEANFCKKWFQFFFSGFIKLVLTVSNFPDFLTFGGRAQEHKSGQVGQVPALMIHHTKQDRYKDRDAHASRSSNSTFIVKQSTGAYQSY